MACEFYRQISRQIWQVAATKSFSHKKCDQLVETSIRHRWVSESRRARGSRMPFHNQKDIRIHINPEKYACHNNHVILATDDSLMRAQRCARQLCTFRIRLFCCSFSFHLDVDYNFDYNFDYDSFAYPSCSSHAD